MASVGSSSSVGANVQVVNGSRPRGDLIFIPIGRDGALGPLNTLLLDELRLKHSIIPKPSELSKGYTIVHAGKRRLCFIVTVGAGGSATLLALNLRAALNDEHLESAKSLWIPLMGTGAGGLSLDRSAEIIAKALKDTPWCNQPSVRITLAYPPTKLPTPPPTPDQKDELPQSPAVTAAIQFAWLLQYREQLKSNPAGFDVIVTTSALLFAIAESQGKNAPRDLAQNEQAAMLSGAIHDLANQARYHEQLGPFLDSSNEIRGASPRLGAELSDNTKMVVQDAEKRARLRGRSSIEMDDLIESMLSLGDDHYRLVLRAMDVSSKRLLEAYRQAVFGSIGTTLLNDVATGTDRLGYGTYAKAITNFLRDLKTLPPLSISIQAPWGVGKSSLMQQIRERLDPRADREKNKICIQAPGEMVKSSLMQRMWERFDPQTDAEEKKKARQQDSTISLRHITLKMALEYLNRKLITPTPHVDESGKIWTVWFNAWKYDTSEQVWAGLVDAIVSQITDRLTPIHRELFLFRLQLARIDDGAVRRKIYDRILTIWWNKVRNWSVLGVGAVAACFGLHHATENLLPPFWKTLISTSPAAATAALAVYLFFSFQLSRKETQSEPASFSLAPYLKVPDYDQTLGSIHHIHNDLLRVLSLVPRSGSDSPPSPIVIFIDDLDRCSPSKVASVVEGVNMFLASDDYRCMFVIGMDPQMIAAALEEAHAKVLEQLPSFECTVPLGWRFMDKFIQLPFTIPPCTTDRLSSYVEWLAAPGDVVDESGIGEFLPEEQLATDAAFNANDMQQSSSDPDASSTNEERIERSLAKAEARFKESRDVGIIIREAVTSTSGNPREIKRLTNVARLYLGLRNARKYETPTWTPPTLAQYARWITLTLRWPDMMRWLQWGADECNWADELASSNLQERRLLVLQATARDANDANSWKQAVAETLNVPCDKATDWVSDTKLFEFFRAESVLIENDRLSSAVANGFW